MQQIAKSIAIIICALVCLAIVAPFFRERTPEAYVRANNEAIRMQPTATAAALANQAEAIRVTIVAPAQATAEAASILANNQQRIDEDAHQQALRHEGEMDALTISNTQRMMEISTTYISRIEGIKASSAKTVSEFYADAQRASAGAWRDTLTYGGIAIGAVILLVGCALGIVAWLSTRAKIINHPITGPMLVTQQGVILLANVTNPVIAWNKQQLLIAGENERALVMQRQAFGLIRSAMDSKQPDMVHAAERAATSTIQQNWTPNNDVLDSAVQALPAVRDDLAGRVPTFAQLLQTWRPTRDKMLLGFNRYGEPVYCSLEDMLSVGIVGRPKTGKTTVLRFVFAQCILVGAEVIVWDLHRTIVGSLPGAQAFTRLDEIDRSADSVMRTLEQRIEQERYNDRPTMVLVDEFPLLAPNSEPATTALNRIILEGRKVQQFSMVAGQGLPAALFGGSTPRDALSSRYVLHTTTRMAIMAGLDKDSAPWVIDLKAGQAVIDGPVDAQVVTIPNTTTDDVRALLPATSMTTSAATSEPLPDWPEATSTEVVGSGGSGHENNDFATSERKQQVLDLLRDGKGKSEVIKIVYGVTGGNGFIKASQEVDRIIQEALS